jgi:hypothetical protein
MTVYTARTELFEIKTSSRLLSTLFVLTESYLVTSDYELLLVITLSETRFITRISSEPAPYLYVPHRLTYVYEEVTPELQHHLWNRENGYTWFGGTRQNRV